MKNSQAHFKIGTRGSKLAVIQAESALHSLSARFPGILFEKKLFDSPGDRDRSTDLRESPGDFFTRDLDYAVLSGGIDAALHSAKDLPDPLDGRLDWFWLPWREDSRDALVWRKGEEGTEPERVGVSSQRRHDYCAKRFPESELLPVRGNVENRIRQLDEGCFDMLILAAAGLIRLDLCERIGEYISLSELPTPPGQGALALIFRKDDSRWRRIRSCLIYPAIFAGAGPGSPDLVSIGVVKALEEADVCLPDALVPENLYMESLPGNAEVLDVGKRGKGRSTDMERIRLLLAEYSRKGKRVVRLKGGDPGLFGRLPEEISILDELELPYRVLPGISSLLAATTGTGLLLTRRGINRGFFVYTPRVAGGKNKYTALDPREAERMPQILFMGINGLEEMFCHYLDAGWPSDTPVSIVFAAGTVDQQVFHCSIGNPESIPPTPKYADGSDLPGLVIVGASSEGSFIYHRHGPLKGRKVLATGSRSLNERCAKAVLDRGGIPVLHPLLDVYPVKEVPCEICRLRNYDWIALSSPAGSEFFLRMLSETQTDVRQVPKIISAGPVTSAPLLKVGLRPEITADPPYGAPGLAEKLENRIMSGEKVLRLRSELAKSAIADTLRDAGAEVDDVVLYKNECHDPGALPDFDAVLFASDSAASRFLQLYGSGTLIAKDVVIIGDPTREALGNAAQNAASLLMPEKSKVENMVDRLAAHYVVDRVTVTVPAFHETMRCGRAEF